MSAEVCRTCVAWRACTGNRRAVCRWCREGAPPWVGDGPPPTTPRSKRAHARPPTAPRTAKCSVCRRAGHDRLTCPKARSAR